MKVTYNWLKDFVDIKVSPEELARQLTMSGSEVTSLEAKGDDFVFEIEITSNRPDCLSIIGLAREVAAITNVKLSRQGGIPPKAKRAPSDFKIKIEDKKDCPLYTARIIKGVKVGPSPDWLKKRLGSVGCRSVNNVVDITNYVLFELGEPLHAFDLDKLAGDSLIIRRAKTAERLVSIDAQDRSLDPGILVIADRARPLAIAGVMGGKDTEVTESTVNILLEAAVFNPVVVRRGRQKLGIQSEASYRFERGIDIPTVETASLRAAGLIQELGGGILVAHKSSTLPKPVCRKIELDLDSVNRTLGVKIPASRVKNILLSLGFGLRPKAKSRFSIATPSYRQDVKAEIDLTEEIARVFGFEKIPVSLPRVCLKALGEDLTPKILSVKTILNGLGLTEVITHSLVDRDTLKEFGEREDEFVEVLNPLSLEQEVLRSALFPSLCGRVSYNLRQQQPYVNIFEVAKTYCQKKAQLLERYNLGIALCGIRSVWQAGGRISDEPSYLHLTGILQALGQRLGVKEECEFRSTENTRAIQIYLKNARLGTLRRVEGKILERLDIKNKQVYGLEIDLETLLSYAKPERRFAALPRFPGVSRDISLVLAENISAKTLKEFIREAGGELLQEAEIIDYYKGKAIEPGYKGLTISCRYLSTQRTLVEAEIIPIHESIIRGLKEKFQVRLR
jgi:phenylalanyl-tRNA synthetase beta chain